MTSPITLARTACWDAILNWTPLQDSAGKSIFKRQDRFEKAGPTRKQIESGYGPADLPAIAIVSRAIRVEHETTTRQVWFFDLQISCWFPDWSLELPEFAAAEIANALYASTPTGMTVSYVKNPATGTGYDPQAVALQFGFSHVGGDVKIPATKLDLMPQLRFNFSQYE
jgi:hypothetical protein